MISSQIVPWSYKKLGARKVISIGLICTAVIFVLLSFVNHDTNPWQIRALLFGIGIFLGQSVGAVQFSAFNNITPPSMGRATTIFNVQNRLGSAIGVAFLASILAVLEVITFNPIFTISSSINWVSNIFAHSTTIFFTYFR